MVDPEKKTPRSSRTSTQFSIRLLLVLITVAAIASFAYASHLREQQKIKRPFEFVAAIVEGDYAKIDKLLTIDPTLAHGREKYKTTWDATALQMSLTFEGDPAVSAKIYARILRENPDVNETNIEGETALTQACLLQRHGLRNYLPIVQDLLDRGADPNHADPPEPPLTGESPLTPLQAAVWAGPEFVTLLLAAGADPNLPHRRDGRRCLLLATDKKTLTALLDAGADVNAADSEGDTALHLMMVRHWYKAASLLVERGANLVARNSQGDIPGDIPYRSNVKLWWMTIVRLHESGNVAEIDKLLAAAPEVLTWPNKHPLVVQAALERKVDILQYLLERGADPNLVYRDWNLDESRTPLHAIAMQHWDWGMEHTDVTNAQWHKVIQVMVDAGAVMAKDANGRTPLHGAAISQNHIVAQALLDHGADINAVSNDGTTIVDMMFDYQFHPVIGPQTIEVLANGGHKPTVLYAAATGNVDLLEKFKEEDPEFINREISRKKITPLFVAVVTGQLEAAKWLIEAGADITVRTPEHWFAASNSSLLCLAASYGHVDVAVLLIESGIELNQPDFGGTPPLHQAALGGVLPEIFAAMLEHGADLTLRFKGKTVRETLEQRKQFHGERQHAVMMKILEKYEAKEKQSKPSSQSLLQAKTAQSRLEIQYL